MSTNVENEVEDEQAATTGRRLDPELKVIGAVLRLLDELDEPAKGRAVRYLSDRYILP